ncbi:MAG: hypothetical protein D6815_03175 [Candidatus Dadabacteria bacterium]|nr:MAG: hypothetical protein D6815_03175 [Candidatus Dadabacteria bacterium]
MARRIGSIAAVVLAAAVACHPRHEVQQRPPVVLFALDGATWTLLDPFMERGLLPNLERLRRQGTWGVLESMQPSSSPVIWTTVATGKKPQKHGITFFVRFPDGDPGHPKPVDSRMRRAKAIWNILSAKGFDVAVVGWFVTWPPEEVNGRMISDRAHYPASRPRAFPPGYLADLPPASAKEAVAAAPRFMDPGVDLSRARKDSANPDERIAFLITDRFVKAYARDAFYLRAAERVLSDGPLPDFFALYLRGTDDVQHGFWKFMDPEPFGDVPPEHVRRYGKVIERYWQWIDKAVGRVLEHYRGENPLVLVVSDHGAGPGTDIDVPAYLHLSGSHRKEGVLIAAGPGIRKGARIEGASVYDITPTLLHYLGLPVAQDMDGRVLVDLFTGELASRPVRRIATYEDARPPAHPQAPPQSADDQRILEHLRSLGYIQ